MEQQMGKEIPTNPALADPKVVEEIRLKRKKEAEEIEKARKSRPDELEKMADKSGVIWN